MIIIANSSEIWKHDRPDLSVLREIWNYSKCVSKIDYVKIIINSTAADTKSKNMIVQKKHFIGLEYHKWRFTLIRKDGSEWEAKSVFLNY